MRPPCTNYILTGGRKPVMPNTAESTAVCVICGKELPPPRWRSSAAGPSAAPAWLRRPFSVPAAAAVSRGANGPPPAGAGSARPALMSGLPTAASAAGSSARAKRTGGGRMVRSDRSAPAVWRPAREPQSARQKKGTFTQNGGLAHGTNKTERNVEGWEKRRCPMRIP